LKITELVDYQDGSVVSRIVVKAETGGDAILMPANEPHAVKAVKQFKVLLTMIRA
jgi:quercetin dioxygenase-like cupin family protein